MMKTGIKLKKDVPPDHRHAIIHPFLLGSFCVIGEQTNRQTRILLIVFLASIIDLLTNSFLFLYIFHVQNRLFYSFIIYSYGDYADMLSYFFIMP